MPSSKTRSTIGHLVLTTELIRKLAAVQSLKADVSSVSPSSVRLKELWVVCGLCVGLYAENGATLLVGIWRRRFSLHLGTSESRQTLAQKCIFQMDALNPHGISERFSSKQTSNTLYVWRRIYVKFSEYFSLPDI